MKKTLLSFIFLVSFICAKPLEIDEHSSEIFILPYAKIYLDTTKKLSFEEVKGKKFEQNSTSILAYGYSLPFVFWSKFTLQNISNETVEKIIDFDHPIANEVILYENNKPRLDGLQYKPDDRSSINPNFKIKLNPYEKKTFYLKASTLTTGLIVNLKLYNTTEYFKNDLQYQVALALFFGAMVILGVYNLFLYVFTKDIAYLYYVFHIFAITFHQLLYLGFGQIYIFDTQSTTFIFDLAVAKVFLPLIASILFTREFLNTKKYPILDKIFITYLIIMPIVSILCYKNIILDSDVLLITVIPLIFFLIFVGIRALVDKNKLAKLYLLGWSTILSSWFFMALANVGLFNIFTFIPYYVEIALVFEGVVFSIALAKRINILKDEKQQLNDDLIIQQQNEKERLKVEVANKTQNLTQALKQKNSLLNEKELLMKELHHRVKNNMQMIISLIRLQSRKVNGTSQNILTIAINRIKAMSNLHELLYKQDNLSQVNTYNYFFSIIETLKDSFVNDIKINYRIHANLNTDIVIYCGLIINELISNSLKHAFNDNAGIITVKLDKSVDNYTLIIEDNGCGFDTNNSVGSLGLLIVNTLVEEQLHGSINYTVENGTKITITWEE